MKARDEIDTSQFLYLHAPTRGAEIEGQSLQRDDAMGEAVQMRVMPRFRTGHVVHPNDRDIAPGEEMLQRKHLVPGTAASPAQAGASPTGCRRRRAWVAPFDFGLDQLDRFAQLHFPGMEDRLAASVPEHAMTSNESRSRSCDAATTSI